MSVTNIERLKELRHEYAIALADFHESGKAKDDDETFASFAKAKKEAKLSLDVAVAELLPALIAVAEAGKRLISHAAGNNPIKDEHALIDAIAELEGVKLS